MATFCIFGLFNFTCFGIFLSTAMEQCNFADTKDYFTSCNGHDTMKTFSYICFVLIAINVRFASLERSAK